MNIYSENPDRKRLVDMIHNNVTKVWNISREKTSKMLRKWTSRELRTVIVQPKLGGAALGEDSGDKELYSRFQRKADDDLKNGLCPIKLTPEINEQLGNMYVAQAHTLNFDRAILFEKVAEEADLLLSEQVEEATGEQYQPDTAHLLRKPIVNFVHRNVKKHREKFGAPAGHLTGLALQDSANLVAMSSASFSWTVHGCAARASEGYLLPVTYPVGELHDDREGFGMLYAVSVCSFVGLYFLYSTLVFSPNCFLLLCFQSSLPESIGFLSASVQRSAVVVIQNDSNATSRLQSIVEFF